MPIAHSIIAYKAIIKGLDKLVLNENIGTIVNWLYENSKIITKEINKYGKYKLSIDISKVNFDRMKSKFSSIVIVK